MWILDPEIDRMLTEFMRLGYDAEYEWSEQSIIEWSHETFMAWDRYCELYRQFKEIAAVFKNP
jgi:hypothetical protein